MCALFNHYGTHQKDQKNQEPCQGGAGPEHVEIGQRRRLLVPGVLEGLEREFARQAGVGGVLHEEGPAPVQKIVDGWIKCVQFLIEAEGMKLFAPFLDGLCDGCADAAAFVAQQGEQADGSAAKVWNITS